MSRCAGEVVIVPVALKVGVVLHLLFSMNKLPAHALPISQTLLCPPHHGRLVPGLLEGCAGLSRIRKQ